MARVKITIFYELPEEFIFYNDNKEIYKTMTDPQEMMDWDRANGIYNILKTSNRVWQ